MAEAEKRTRRILAVSHGRGLAETLSRLLAGEGFEFLSASDGEEALRMHREEPVPMAVISLPLPDGKGMKLAAELSEGPTAVLVLLPEERLIELRPAAEERGILTLGRPIGERQLKDALHMLAAMSSRLWRMEERQQEHRRRMTDLRLCDRAKCLLIEQLKMTEKDAHHYIEQRAMSLRQSKREVAESIIRTYEQ